MRYHVFEENGKRGLRHPSGYVVVPPLFDDIAEQYDALGKRWGPTFAVPVIRDGKYALYVMGRPQDQDFQKTGWKYFDLAFQFDRQGLDGLIFGFVCKGNSKRSDIPAPIWEKVQEHYSITSKIKNWDSDLWIHKDFRRNCNWNNAQTIKDLLNGKTLNDFSIMFDEAIDCVKGLDI